ncbi:MAG TPA: ATP-binding protein [Candidatus Saccharimonadales bacterium]|nr:ATP-binding protein [Candidatus Saccharimonadales bacterium]
MPDMPSTTPLSDRSAAELEHERLVSLINSMVDGVIAVDERARVALYNGAALNILDSNSSIVGRSLGDVCQLLDKNSQPVDFTDLVREARTSIVSRDYRLQYGDGSRINLYISIAPVHISYGRDGQRGYVVLLRDITHEKSLEEERDEFISVVSHELRTPIAIAEGNIANAQFILEKGGSTEDIKKALQQAHDQTVFLASMINDLSTLSRAERGKLTIDIDTINVHDLLMDLRHSYTPQAAEKGLRLTTHISPHIELLSSSKLYVREIMQNFITNAIKYTEKGHVTIGAKPAEKGVLLWVEDTGIGISVGDQEKVYDKFFRSEDYRTRQNNGTGLGLYVTMKLTRLVHGELSLTSRINKGSRFTIFIPNLT